MEKSYHLSIITPNKKIFENDIVSLIAPSELGYLGILANHAPLVTTLDKGKIIIRDAKDRLTILQTTGGFLEVANNQATVLSETIRV